MVIYFSGTGNSEYIGKLIAKKLGDCVTDAARLIRSDKCAEFSSEKPYVFVAPIYAWRLPRVFRAWISKCKFEGNKKVYFVITCGSDIGAAGNYIKKFASKLGFEYMGTEAVVMPDNYIIMFQPDAEEADNIKIENAERYVLEFCERIASENAFDKVKIKPMGYIESSVVNSSFYTFYIGAKKFYATDACISCGKCVENCMLDNIVLKDGKPVWSSSCTHCMACISKCPAKAIEYGKNTKGKRRYLCPKKLNLGVDLE